ncbi:peptidase C14 caspase catalytic subunit p20 [Anaeromyxobacter dehalogenans 2CP-1]|uniref:Peptidase C14 caspase catalytic subunit p20 n=1 Tax=Anaeromyxobacter dehalogenans (strain ATCC BAA-258 / DSM 21875 / 2CP-1) TaxID=455488 RepID=B8JEK4_ANAD2|nr:caspase family protein [Anaeromyxobacter dehalogenans]ACL64330.1 peptidase C14 caspase catalytic subunit p20 [Anaeromyxobacter dehalogenans 2CP-1]
MTPRHARRVPSLALAAALAALAARPAAAVPAPSGALRRFALLVGVNDGGPGRTSLRYAGTDAERMDEVLRRVGGVAAGDAVLLREPTAAGLRAALSELGARVAAVRGAGRVEVLLYYSGHSDEEGLLVRGARIPYAEVRGWLDGLGAQVRIAILDSCASGAFTRGKGGTRAAPFLVDASSRVSGRAILTSSAADEASQESDRIGASFFTHALVTGLRGAADTSQDGRVTLSEAYQFAFQETLARTERTRSGPQHPEWDIQLAGAGEVVLTELRGGGAALVVPDSAQGRWFVRDDGERLVAELRKYPGRPVALALEPGTYRVTAEEGDRLREARVTLADGQRLELSSERFASVARERTAARGGALETAFVDLALFPPLSTNGDRAVENHLQLGLIASRATRLTGVGIGTVLWVDEDVRGVQLGMGNAARGEVVGLQLGSMGNLAGALRGGQYGALANVVRGDGRGVQVGGVVGWTGGAFTGLQANAVVSYAAEVHGLQTAVTSVVGALSGAQLGVVNVGGAIHGAQVGVVNVARSVRGAQVGVVNVADTVEGASVGLVPLVRDGEQRLLLLGNDAGMLEAGVLLGSRRVHTLLTGAVQRTGDDARLWTGLGLGVRMGGARRFADVDLIGQSVPDEPIDHVRGTLRVLGGWQVARRLALVAGPTVNVLWSRDPAFDPGVAGTPSRELGHGDRVLRLWAGFAAGLRI